MGWRRRAKLLSGLQDISAFDYKQVCHNQGSPRSEENLYISQWRLEIILDSDRKTEDTGQCKCFQTKLGICMWWQTFEKVFQTASSSSLVTIRIEYVCIYQEEESSAVLLIYLHQDPRHQEEDPRRPRQPQWRKQGLHDQALQCD